MKKPLSEARRQEIIARFASGVNMTATELARWLETDMSLSVGITRRGERESVGHRSGRCIVGLLGLHPAELEDEDVAHMRKVVGFIARHAANRPAGDVTKTRWRYSLMNWGHDPLKR